ncbi:MAG TPA: hypothetical protein VM580_07950, partial [Labilithrix sp.]|nr:hypothetical protein [Labilithrix sp.]
MSDVLLEVTKNPAARGLIKTLGLPIPLPEPLARARAPWMALPFERANIVVGGAGAPPGLLREIAGSLAEAGATIWVDASSGDGALAAFTEAGEAYARPARPDSALQENARIDALVFDASTLASAKDLQALHAFFQSRIARLKRCGRVVVLGRTISAGGAAPEVAATQAALSGFGRSVAKEIGRKGSTANLLLVERGAEARL